MKLDLEKYANNIYSDPNNRWRKMYFVVFDEDNRRYFPGPTMYNPTVTCANNSLDAERFRADILGKIKCGEIYCTNVRDINHIRFNQNNGCIEYNEPDNIILEIGLFGLRPITVVPKIKTIVLGGYKARFDESKSSWVIHWTTNGKNVHHVADIPDTENIDDILDVMVKDMGNS